MTNLTTVYRYENNIEVSVSELEKLAQDLINTEWKIKVRGEVHVIRLSDDNWSFGWNNRKRALGLCSPRRKMIYLSKDSYKSNSDMAHAWEEVIRHEVAHALDVKIRRTSDHSYEWKNIAVQTLATPKATTDAFRKIETQYISVCPNCGNSYPIHKMTKRRREAACTSCCNEFNGGRFSSEFILEVKLNPLYGMSRSEINKLETDKLKGANEKEVETATEKVNEALVEEFLDKKKKVKKTEKVEKVEEVVVEVVETKKEEEPIKVCKDCGDAKPHSEFRKASDRKDGRACRCRDCYTVWNSPEARAERKKNRK